MWTFLSSESITSTSVTISKHQSAAENKMKSQTNVSALLWPVAKMRFHVVPNAKQDKIAGERGGAIKIKLRAPAMEGKANAALQRFLAEKLRIAERQVVLEHGEK